MEEAEMPKNAEKELNGKACAEKYLKGDLQSSTTDNYSELQGPGSTSLQDKSMNKSRKEE